MRALVLALAIFSVFTSCSHNDQPHPSARNVGDNSAENQLDPRIPPPDPDKYKSIREGRDWRNPFLSIQGSGIYLMINSSPGEGKLIQADELSNTRRELPVSDWPYGKIIAAVDGGGPQSGTPEARKRNRAKAEEVLKSLGVEIDWWPGA